MKRLRAWLRCATDRRTVGRALITSSVVGSVLTLVNHGTDIAAGSLGREAVWSILLTFGIPFIVATISRVEAIQSGPAARAR